MPVYKDDKTGKWMSKFRYKDWSGKTKDKMKRGFLTRREALEWENDFKSRIAGDLEMKMRDFIEIYKEERFPRIKAVTREQKEYVIEDKILPYFGDMPLNSITSKDIIKWQNELINYRTPEGKPYSKSYLKTIHCQLNAIFNYAKRYYNLQTNPASIAGNIGSDKELEMNFWTTEEYLKFAEEVMCDPPYYYFFEILYWLGLREGEALALTKKDFDFKNKTVSVSKTYQKTKDGYIFTSPKSVKSNRVISMPDFICEEILEYFDLLPEVLPDSRIFFMLTKSNVTRRIVSAAKRAGVKRIRVHDLRHSHVSLLINMGYSAVAIADRMGHESIHITYRYAHLFPNVQDDMANKLNNLMNNINTEGK